MKPAIEPILNKIKQKWRKQNILYGKEATNSDILRFEKEHQITFSAQLKEYFLQVNGMNEYTTGDENGFAFWSLDRLSLFQKDKHNPRYNAYLGDFVIFVDYLVWCWAYAMPTNGRPEVLLVGGNQPVKVADTLFEFFELYMIDSEKLYRTI